MSMQATYTPHVPAPGSRLMIRGEEWIVRRTQRTFGNDYLIHVTGLSPLVRDSDWQFNRNLEEITEVRPEETKLVMDESSHFIASRLHIESLLRSTPPPNNQLYLGNRGAMDQMFYQFEPALRALKQPRPRILIADGTGLGKTLEAGILISELIRRGRGKRILVVSLASMMTQFQKELWSRFSIPLIRLDSIGINRVRDQLPAGHNPFHHFDRAIISIDTLKTESTWRPFLEKSNWDIVVIDEVQNVAKRKSGRISQRHKLAEILSSRCDSLIMLSATPHDGSAESFASLIKMLDPTVIADDKNYSKEDLHGKNLLVRRFKKDIRDQAELMDRHVSLCPANASLQEEQVFGMITDTRLEELSRRTGNGWLLRTTMEKAVLSSPAACLESVENRINKLEKKGTSEDQLRPWYSIRHALNEVGSNEFSKYQLLLTTIQSLQWTGKDPHDRLLIFTERIATLKFLQTHLSRDLGLAPNAVQVLHGSLPDVEQQQVVDEFGQDHSSVRLLISSDVGSEGINLHYHCSRLIHFDIPWSLMRLQQRNGRIDRYGQESNPKIYYLITESENEKFKGDARILELLIDKEDQAQKNLGDPATLMGVYKTEEEENRVAEALEGGMTKELAENHLISPNSANPNQVKFDPLAALLTSTPKTINTDETTGTLPSLFASDYLYTKSALTHIKQNWANRMDARLHSSFDDEKQLVILTSQNQKGKLALKGMKDQLPIPVRPKDDRFVFSSNPDVIMRSIKKCRAQDNTWPETQYLWPVHPFMEWMTDKIRMSFGRLDAPAIRLSSVEPRTFSYLITVLWPNKKGITIFQRWYLVTARDRGANFRVELFEDSNIYQTLQSGQLPNTQRASSVLDHAMELIPEAVTKAKERVHQERSHFDQDLRSTLNKHLDDLEELENRHRAHVQNSFQLNQGIEQVQISRREKGLQNVSDRFSEFRRWIETSMTMEEDPYVHVAAAILAEDGNGV